MIQNRNIVCFSTPPWESNYASTTVQLMHQLALHNNVLFVNNPFTIKDVADGLAKKKNVPLKKVFGVKDRLKKITLENGRFVSVLTPPMVLSIQFLPRGFVYNSLLRWNGFLLRRTVTRYLKKLGMHDNLIVLVAFNPTVGLEVANRFNEKLLLYLCYDEIVTAPHLHKHGAWQEKAFARQADAILVTSQGLYERKHALSKRCFLVKNGGDFSLFSQGFNAQIHTKKTVGFIGGIDRRLDYDLLEAIISRLPQVQFHFVGRVVLPEGAARLRAFKNVTLEPPQPLAALPQRLQRFSVGIIPFRCTELLKTVYPLKINEYLAAGLPVVSTNFSFLDDFASVISIAQSVDAFINAVIVEMNSDSPEKKKARQAVAQTNTWAHRAEDLSRAIELLESEKS